MRRLLKEPLTLPDKRRELVEDSMVPAASWNSQLSIEVLLDLEFETRDLANARADKPNANAGR
jgi:hypothetical protein